MSDWWCKEKRDKWSTTTQEANDHLPNFFMALLKDTHMTSKELKTHTPIPNWTKYKQLMMGFSFNFGLSVIKCNRWHRSRVYAHKGFKRSQKSSGGRSNWAVTTAEKDDVNSNQLHLFCSSHTNAAHLIWIWFGRFLFVRDLEYKFF